MLALSSSGTKDQKTKKIRPPKLHALQEAIAHSFARFQVVVCGRRWGKTRLGAWKALKTIVAGGRVWWVAPVYQTANIVWRILKPMIEQIPGSLIRESERCFYLPGSGELWIKSADRPDNLRGEGLNGLIIDEADFIPGEIWSKVLRPALADRKGWALFISTPNVKEGWFHKLYLLGLSGKNPQWGAWHHPSWTNPFLDPQEIEDAKEDMSAQEFAQEFGGEFVQSQDTVYHNFDESLNVASCPFDPSLHLYLGVDFNNYPRVGVFLQKHADVFWVVGEVYHATTLTTEQHAMLCVDWLRARGIVAEEETKKIKGVTVIPDSSGKNLRHDGGTDVGDFEKAGFVLEYPAANPGIKDRDNTLLARIRNANGRVRLLIDPCCKHLIQCFRQFKNKARGQSPWGHMLDALGYAISWLVAGEVNQQASEQLMSAARGQNTAKPQKRGSWSTY